MNSRTGTIAAFRHSSFKSEPESPSACSARVTKGKSGESLVSFNICFIFYFFIRVFKNIWDKRRRMSIKVLTSLRIFARCSRSGNPIPKRFGIRRRMAESMSLGLFVAPRTRIRSVAESKPSHSLEIKSHMEKAISQNEHFEEGEQIKPARHEFGFHHPCHLMIAFRSFS